MIQAPGQSVARKQRVLHTPLMMLNVLPPQVRQGVIKGILVEVNRKKGLVELKYNLPADLPLDGLPLSEQIVETVYRSAEQTKVPILT